MIIILKDGKPIRDVTPVTMYTGYKAASIIMKKGDFAQLRSLAKKDPAMFHTVMIQLENRFQ